MKIIWRPKAIQARRQIAEYIRNSFGETAKSRYILEVRETIKQIKDNPCIGRIDPLFDDRPITYRSVIISRLSKLVYNIDGDAIYIAGFWDCRREPNAQAEQVK